jgi:hypothetical protein
MKNFLSSSFIVAATMSLLFTSCKKTDLSFDENDKAIAQENAIAQQHFADIASIADEASSKEGISNFRIAGGSCVTMVKAAYSGHPAGAIVTVNFNGNCIDNKVRSGQIIISYSDTSYKNKDAQALVTFSGYKVGDVSISGSVVLKNITAAGAGNVYEFNMVVDATLTQGTQSSSFTCNITKTWDLGTNLIDSSDDIYTFTGGASGTTFNGTNYSAKIGAELKKFANYRCIVSGNITLTNAASTNTSTKTIDFGDGTRDNKATLTEGSVTKEIEL